MQKNLKKVGWSILAVTKRVLSAAINKKTDVQIRKKILLILSGKLVLVLMKATRIRTETTGAKFV